MAHIELESARVAVELQRLDEVLSLHGNLYIPYQHIRAVSTAPVPEAWFRGIRIGTNLPGIKVAATFYTPDGAVFYDYHDRTRCLTLDLDHETLKRAVVQVDADQDRIALAQAITARLPRAAA